MKYVDKLKGLIQDKLREIGREKPDSFIGVELYLSEVKEYREIFDYLEAQRPIEILDSKDLDDLLASIPKGQYYLKLYKEVELNSYEFKLKITNFSEWTDFEAEIAKIVKAYTEVNFENWGSGKYRVVIFYGAGLNNSQKFRPLDFLIDACKEEAIK